MPSPSVPPAPPAADPPPGCPTDEELAAFVEGTLDAGAVGLVEAHVDSCVLCYHVLASLARDGAAPTTTPLASPLHWPSPSESQSHVGAVARLQALRPLAPGTTLGRFVVLAWIGQGAAGVVYAAYDPELDRKVALKLMPPAEAAEREDVRARVLGEARAMGKATHPNVVTVHDVGTFEDRVFLAMELVVGTTLREWLGAEPRDQSAILRVFLEAGRGLAAAHGAGLVHRDFKPSNVLIGDDGRVRVSDFGLASPAEREGAIAGTPAYMAPEQKRGGPVGARSDQWSFCVALYEALYGESPFAERGLEATGGALRDASPRSRVPGRLRASLVRGLHPDPSQRHGSMDDLLAALSFDPRARWRRVSLVAAAVVALTSLGVAYREHRAGANALVCRGAERKLAGVWDRARKLDVHRAFAATDRGYAEEAFRAVDSALDAYSGEWVAAYTDACEATQVRGEQSPQLLDLRMTCLADRLTDVRALTGVLAAADGTVVLNAQKATHSLESLAPCADVRALGARAGREPPPAVAVEVTRIREKIALAQASRGAGRTTEAAQLAELALVDARATGFRPLIAAALYEQAQTLEDEGDSAAREALESAAGEADRAGDDVLRARASSALIFELTSQEERTELLPFLRSQVEAALDRSGGDAEAEVGLHNHLGAALMDEGKWQEARAELERALALSTRPHLERPLDTAGIRENLAIVDLDEGKPAEALVELDQGLAEMRAQVGDDHPKVAFALSNRGTAREQTLDFVGARDDFDRARTITERASGASGTLWAGHLVNDADVLVALEHYGAAAEAARTALAVFDAETPNSADTGLALRALGQAYVGQGDYERALPVLERAVTFPNADAPDVLAAAQFALARTLLDGSPRPTVRARVRALALAEKARVTYQGRVQVPLCARNLAAVETWLSSHTRS